MTNTMLNCEIPLECTNIPVVVYPKEYVNRINFEIKNLKEKIKSGKQPVFNNVEDLINELEKS